MLTRAFSLIKLRFGGFSFKKNYYFVSGKVLLLQLLVLIGIMIPIVQQLSSLLSIQSITTYSVARSSLQNNQDYQIYFHPTVGSFPLFVQVENLN